MLKSKLVLSIILIVACLAQLFSCVFQGNFQNAFMIGLAPSDYGLEITKFLPLLLPVCFILFFTSGSIENLKQGYGKMLIVRNYSKTVLILKRCLNNFIALICIVLFQFIIFFVARESMTPVESGTLKSLIMYFLTIFSLIVIQSLLEISIPVHIVNIGIFIYCFIAYYLVQNFVDAPIWKMLLFPSLMFGMQNGAVSGESIYYGYLLFIVALNALCIFILNLRFKKTDIF